MDEIQREIWSEPLDDHERKLIEKVLDRGSLDDARQWLRHVLKVHDAMVEVNRGKT